MMSGGGGIFKGSSNNFPDERRGWLAGLLQGEEDLTEGVEE